MGRKGKMSSGYVSGERKKPKRESNFNYEFQAAYSELRAREDRREQVVTKQQLIPRSNPHLDEDWKPRRASIASESNPAPTDLSLFNWAVKLSQDSTASRYFDKYLDNCSSLSQRCLQTISKNISTYDEECLTYMIDCLPADYLSDIAVYCCYHDVDIFPEHFLKQLHKTLISELYLGSKFCDKHVSIIFPSIQSNASLIWDTYEVSDGWEELDVGQLKLQHTTPFKQLSTLKLFYSLLSIQRGLAPLGHSLRYLDSLVLHGVRFTCQNYEFTEDNMNNTNKIGGKILIAITESFLYLKYLEISSCKWLTKDALLIWYTYLYNTLTAPTHTVPFTTTSTGSGNTGSSGNSKGTGIAMREVKVYGMNEYDNSTYNSSTTNSRSGVSISNLIDMYKKIHIKLSVHI